MDQYLENILLEDFKHTKGNPHKDYPYAINHEVNSQSSIDLVLFCDSHILESLLGRLKT